MGSCFVSVCEDGTVPREGEGAWEGSMVGATEAIALLYNGDATTRFQYWRGDVNVRRGTVAFDGLRRRVEDLSVAITTV